MITTPIVDAIGQALVVMAFAPLLTGIIKRLKCRFQCRRGPSILQGYRELNKLFRKQPTVSELASWVFFAAPYIVMGSTVCAAFMLPSLGTSAAAHPLGLYADAIIFVYFLAIGRFFSGLAALDTAGSFGGMGASREMFIASMVEPGLMGVLFLAGSASRSLALPAIGGAHPTVAAALGAIALAILTVTETGRVPVDNPDTHLELTMIHEGMLLEYSGQHLALMTWAAQAKQFIIVSLMATLFVPNLPYLGPISQLAAHLCKVLIVGIGLATCECVYAKMRLFRVPSLLETAWALVALGAVASLFI